VTCALFLVQRLGRCIQRTALSVHSVVLPLRNTSPPTAKLGSTMIRRGPIPAPMVNRRCILHPDGILARYRTGDRSVVSIRSPLPNPQQGCPRSFAFGDRGSAGRLDPITLPNPQQGCPPSLAFGDRGCSVAVAHPLGQLPASLAGRPLPFDLHGSARTRLIVAIARPLPILRFLNQPACQWIAMDVAQLFRKLLVRRHVEVVIVSLPERPFPAPQRDGQLEGLNGPG